MDQCSENEYTREGKQWIWWYGNEKKKKKKGKRKELIEETERERKSKEEEDDEWVCERREMKHKNKSNNDVSYFHWLA